VVYKVYRGKPWLSELLLPTPQLYRAQLQLTPLEERIFTENADSYGCNVNQLIVCGVLTVLRRGSHPSIDEVIE
jgi:hypothetical protein